MVKEKEGEKVIGKDQNRNLKQSLNRIIEGCLKVCQSNMQDIDIYEVGKMVEIYKRNESPFCTP